MKSTRRQARRTHPHLARADNASVPLPTPTDTTVTTRPRILPVLERLQRLPPLPAHFRELLNVLDDPEAGIAEASAVVARDPALAAQILQIANSAQFARGTPASTVSEAVEVVGLGLIKGLVLAGGLFRDFESGLRGPVSLDYLWRHSFGTAISSRHLARRFGAGLDPELAFTAGLLHDVGRLVLAHAYGQTYHQEAIRSVRANQPLVLLEREVFGADHAEVAAFLLRGWKLPENLVQAIRWHHEPSGAGEAFNTATAIHLADRLEYLHSGPPPFHPAPADSVHLSTIGLPGDAAALRVLLTHP